MLINTLFAVSCIFILAGCTTPLNVATDGATFATAVRIPNDDVKFISYCDFGEGREWADDIGLIRGIIAITTNAVYLSAGGLNDAFQQREIVIFFKDMNGIDLKHFGLGRQVQFKTADHVVVVQVTRNRQTIDREASEEVYRLIKEHGVAEWESRKFYIQKPAPVYVMPMPVPVR